MKLSELIKSTVEQSKIDVPCELTPGHHSKVYVRTEFEQVQIIDGQPRVVRIDVRVCPDCFRNYAYDISKLGAQLNGAK